MPWPVKWPAYEAAIVIERLHLAVFQGNLTSHHNYFGKLEPGPALGLLDRLSLPDDTEHLQPLRTVLVAGCQSHYADPDAWAAAQPASSGEPPDG